MAQFKIHVYSTEYPDVEGTLNAEITRFEFDNETGKFQIDIKQNDYETILETRYGDIDLDEPGCPFPNLEEDFWDAIARWCRTRIPDDGSRVAFYVWADDEYKDEFSSDNEFSINGYSVAFHLLPDELQAILRECNIA